MRWVSKVEKMGRIREVKKIETVRKIEKAIEKQGKPDDKKESWF